MQPLLILSRYYVRNVVAGANERRLSCAPQIDLWKLGIMFRIIRQHWEQCYELAAQIKTLAKGCYCWHVKSDESIKGKPLVSKMVYQLNNYSRNRAEYRLILSRRGRRPSWLKSDDIPQD